MKRFIKNSIVLLLPVFLIVSSFNLIEDPAHLYGSGVYEEQLANMLLSSKQNVTNVSKNIAVRTFKKIMCENYPEDIDVLVLGSSKALLVSSSNFPGKKVLNLAVDGGTIEDECALMYDCVRSGLKPSLVVLGVDPFQFNANVVEDRTKELRELYAGYIEATGQGSKEPSLFGFDWEKWINLMSFSYFQQGMKKFKTETFEMGNQNMTVTTISENKLDTWHYDGSKSYGENMRNATTEEVEKSAKTYTHSHWKNFNEVSLEKVQSLITLINYIRFHNAEIVILMSPYHPITYNMFMKQDEFRQVKNAEKVVAKIAKKENVKVIGSWNPDVCGCDETDFYDAAHPKVNALDEILGEFLK